MIDNTIPEVNPTEQPKSLQPPKPVVAAKVEVVKKKKPSSLAEKQAALKSPGK